MQIKPFSHRPYTKILSIAFVFVGLYISSLYNYLLFHSLSEFFSIIIQLYSTESGVFLRLLKDHDSERISDHVVRLDSNNFLAIG